MQTLETDRVTFQQVLDDMEAELRATMGSAFNAENVPLDMTEVKARIRAKMAAQKEAVTKKRDEEGDGSAEEPPDRKAAGADMSTATAPVEQADTGTAAPAAKEAMIRGKDLAARRAGGAGGNVAPTHRPYVCDRGGRGRGCTALGATGVRTAFSSIVVFGGGGNEFGTRPRGHGCQHRRFARGLGVGEPPGHHLRAGRGDRAPCPGAFANCQGARRPPTRRRLLIKRPGV